MTTSIYARIRQLWDERGNDLTCPPHLQPVEDEARRLEDLLSKSFEEPVRQWEDGLISATELIAKMMWEAEKPVPAE